MTKESKEVATTNNENFLSLIEKIAMSPDTDVAKMNSILDMQERIIDKKAKAVFIKARIEMKKDLPKIGKNKKNNITNSTYVTLEKIKDAVDPVVAKHGFDIHYENYFPDGKVGVFAILVHEDGHSERNSIELPIDNIGIKGSKNKTDVHGIASSITYAERYALCGLLGIATGDNDGNSINDMTKVLSNEQAVEVDLLIKDSKVNKDRFLNYMGVETVPEILEKDYRKAKDKLLVKKEELEK